MHLGGLLFHCLFFHGRPARRSPASPSVRVDFTCKNTRSVRHLYDLSCTKCNSCCAFCLFAGRSLEKSPNFPSKVPHSFHKVPRFFPFPRPFSPYVSAVFSEKAETLTEIIPTRSRAHAKSSEVPAGFFEKSADEQFVTRDLSKHRSPVFQRAARRVSPPCGGIRCALGTLRELARLSPTADRGNERGVTYRKTKTAPLRMEKRRQCEGDQARAIRDWG